MKVELQNRSGLVYFTAAFNVPIKIAKNIRNGRGTAKQKLERQLSKKEIVDR